MAAKDDISKFAIDLEKQLKRSVSTNELKALGAFVLDMVKARVRKGFGVPSDGAAQEKLKPLSQAYKEQRKRLRLSPFTSPNKSNLTLSGGLIGGLKVTTRTGSVLIQPTGKTKRGLSRETLAEYVSKVRPFLHLSRSEISKMTKFFEEKILNKNIK